MQSSLLQLTSLGVTQGRDHSRVAANWHATLTLAVRPNTLESDGAATAMTYREPLPEDCPPDNAQEITAPRVVYRLVRSNPPTDDDFRSQREERPDQVFHDVTECRARGCRCPPASRLRKGGQRGGT